ncbi:multiple epidermal growth factor-like domains protein 11 isoform X2 [Ostrea edulis]|uniref:multiple epidermal growth factor-like domains protein 11 isoform X2 n=1 Tax=Ostrea edulis TaxID=37623 RepID=UPI0024AF3219|nr:multiple epidermal growth factor-like domains protein 11 isoform X2 [Ostrea edulis]
MAFYCSITLMVVIYSYLYLQYTCVTMELPICPGFFKDCCPDFKWDETKESCVECLPGFAGVNCSTKCKYPYFGKKCGQRCTCSNTTCDHVTGCPIIECLLGFTGVNCSTKCEYPYFGKRCGQNCTCSNTTCDHVTGCPINECLPGFAGVNCSTKCKYPYFGKRCGQNCTCSNTICDHVTGCPIIENGIYHIKLNKLHISVILCGSVLGIVLVAFIVFTSVNKCSSGLRRNRDGNETTHYATVQEMITLNFHGNHIND